MQSNKDYYTAINPPPSTPASKVNLRSFEKRERRDSGACSPPVDVVVDVVVVTRWAVVLIPLIAEVDVVVNRPG